MSVASALGLVVDDALVLSNSNRLVVRLVPCDVVARVAPIGHFASADLEVEVAKLLAQTGSPVAELDPRAEPRTYLEDAFRVALWTYWEPKAGTIRTDEYVQALTRLHDGLRQLDLPVPHFLDRVAANRRDVENHEVTPDLSAGDRALLATTFRDVPPVIVGHPVTEQLIHGEPHPWNMLNTASGPLFIDFENTSRGPLEYDLAWVPDEVSARYPDADQALVNTCRGLVMAIIATHRWTKGDEHPSGRESGVAFLCALREGPPWPAIDEVDW